jgi:hypothetical protein
MKQFKLLVSIEHNKIHIIPQYHHSLLYKQTRINNYKIYIFILTLSLQFKHSTVLTFINLDSERKYHRCERHEKEERNHRLLITF